MSGSGRSLLSRSSAPRTRARGLTLIEVLIVLVILVLLTGGAVFATGQIQRSRLNSAASKIMAGMRTAYQRSSSTGRRLRLVIDMGQSTVWIEESADVMLLTNGAAAGGADPATETEKLALAEANRVQSGPQAPKASFQPIAGPGGQPQALPSGIRVRGVDAAHEPAVRTSDRAYVYFFGSEAERASVQLQINGDDDPKHMLSVVLAPLTAKASILEGPVSIPHPRDDAEASEAEDDGR